MKPERYGCPLNGSLPLLRYCPGLDCELDIRPLCTAEEEKIKNKEPLEEDIDVFTYKNN